MKIQTEFIIGIISIVIYVIGIIFTKTKPQFSKILKYIALGLMVVAVIISVFLKDKI